MDLTSGVIRMATRLLPRESRDRFGEQWLADLRDAEEVGLSRGQVAWGAAMQGLIALPRRYGSGERAGALLMGGQVMVGRQRRVLMGAMAVVLVTLVGWQLWSGFQQVPLTAYRSPQDIVADFFNGPMRLLFPIAVALLAGSGLAAQLADRFIVSMRTRTDIRGLLARRIAVVTAVAFGVFFAIGVVTVVAAYYVAPAALNVQFDPSGYGLHSAGAIAAESVSGAPLTAALAHGPVVYMLAVGAWEGLNAAVLALVTVVSVLLIERRVLALLVPLGVYMFESVVLQLAGIPGASFLISATYPAGLSRYSLAQAAAPTVILAGVALSAAAWIVGSARTNSRLA